MVTTAAMTTVMIMATTTTTTTATLKDQDHFRTTIATTMTMTTKVWRTLDFITAAKRLHQGFYMKDEDLTRF